MAAIACTSCNAALTTHCTSKACHWMRCENRLCAWWIYDLERGARSTVNGTVETLGRPPIAPEMDGA